MGQPMIIRTVMVRVNDELEVAYRPWGAEKFGGLPLVCVHGDWATSAYWTPLASELTECWILAPDLRGRGLTRAPDSGYSIAELAQDLLGFLDVMDLRRVHLIGHGLGAAVAAELAMHKQKRVASLTMISPPHVEGLPPALADREQAERFKADPRAFTRTQSELAPKAPRDMFWATLIEAGHKQKLGAALATLDALVDWQPGRALGGLIMPRQVVDGELDTIAGGEVAAAAADALECERITLHKCGHHVPLEAPEPLAESIRALILSAGG